MVEEIWNDFDDDFSNTLDEQECYNFMNVLVQKKSGANQALEFKEFQKFFSKHDADGDGFLDKEEVVTIFLDLIEGQNPVSKNQLKQMIYSALMQEVNADIVQAF